MNGSGKMEAFLENAGMLYDLMGITPLLYGSLGLQYLTGEDLSADAGELYYEGGQKVDGHVPISEEETRRMAINIWDWDPEEVEAIDIE